jgi:glutaredoxin
MYIVYGKKMCNYCDNAIRLLRSRGFDFEYHSMDNRLDELKDLSTTYNWRTVPLILKKEDGNLKLVGGYDDLVKTIKVKVSTEDDIEDSIST